MTVSVTCSCGRTYSVSDAWKGRRVKCKACGARMTVPAEDVGEQPEPAETAASGAAAGGPADSSEPSSTQSQDFGFPGAPTAEDGVADSPGEPQAPESPAEGTDGTGEAAGSPAQDSAQEDSDGGQAHPREISVAGLMLMESLLFALLGLLIGVIAAVFADEEANPVAGTVGLVIMCGLGPYLGALNWMWSKSMLESMDDMGPGAGCMLMMMYGPAGLLVRPFLTVNMHASGFMNQHILNGTARLAGKLGFHPTEYETYFVNVSHINGPPGVPSSDTPKGTFVTPCESCGEKVLTTPDRKGYFQKCTECGQTFKVERILRRRSKKFGRSG